MIKKDTANKYGNDLNNGRLETKNMTIFTRARLIVMAIAALGLCFIGGLLLVEWIRIGIIADPQVISRYYFGGEAHGGWRYSSSSTYAWSAFVEGMCLLGLGVFTFWATLKAKNRKAAIGLVIFIVWFVINQLSVLYE